jgi:hypothetical protein
MRIRNVLFSALVTYAVFFREGDNEPPKLTIFHGGKAPTKELVAYAQQVAGEHTVTLLGTGVSSYDILPESKPKLGPWLMFERAMILRYQSLYNQPRVAISSPPRAQYKPEPGWAVLLNPRVLKA